MLTRIIVFLKVEEEATKVVHFNSACSFQFSLLQNIASQSYFWNSAAWTRSFQGPYSILWDLSQGLICFTLDCSFERCRIYLSFSEVLRLGQGLVKDGAPSVPALLGIML